MSKHTDNVEATFRAFHALLPQEVQDKVAFAFLPSGERNLIDEVDRLYKLAVDEYLKLKIHPDKISTPLIQAESACFEATAAYKAEKAKRNRAAHEKRMLTAESVGYDAQKDGRTWRANRYGNGAMRKRWFKGFNRSKKEE